jgi:hypothetical protein
MIAIGLLFVRMLCDYFKSRPQLEAEIVILRHQLNLLQRRARRRPHLRWVDRALFIWLYRRCPRVLRAITIVRPETVLRWHRMGFAAYWRWMSRLKLGIAVAQSTVSIYMVPRLDRPLQTWKTFLSNHMEGIASIDLFVVPRFNGCSHFWFSATSGFAREGCALQTARRTVRRQSAVVGPNLIVIGRVFREDSPKVLGVEHQQMVRALASDRADQAFNISILPRGTE